jgi:hypothetical protein
MVLNPHFFLNSTFLKAIVFKNNNFTRQTCQVLEIWQVFGNNFSLIYIVFKNNNFTKTRHRHTPTPSQEGNKPLKLHGFIPLLRGGRGVSVLK